MTRTQRRVESGEVVDESIWAERKRGQWMGFVLSFVLVAAACALALADREISGGVLGVGGLAGMLRAFVPPAARIR
jgi:hypothetical protein